MFGRDVTGARFGSLPVHRASAVERLYELATETTRVAAAGQVNERADGDGALFEVTLTGESVPSALTEHGTNVRSMHAAAGGSRVVVVEVAPEANVSGRSSHTSTTPSPRRSCARNGSIESADGVGVRVEIVGIFGHCSRNSCEDSETASKSRDDARSIRKRRRNSPRFRHHRRNERRELLRSPAIRPFTVIFTVTCRLSATYVVYRLSSADSIEPSSTERSFSAHTGSSARGSDTSSST